MKAHARAHSEAREAARAAGRGRAATATLRADLAMPSLDPAFPGIEAPSLMRRISRALSILHVLTKFRIATLSTLSAASGFLIADPRLRPSLAVVVAGTLLLACGAAALNQVQEWRKDALMDRTRHRPIPSGELSPGAALAISLSLAFGGAAVLLMGVGPIPALLGLAALGSYNFFYTYLKKVTAFAVVPGSIIGAIPPAMGWTAAGGNLMDPRILALCFFFYLWQIPHFWLLLMKYGGQYEKAGYPSLTALFTTRQLARMTFVWMVATAASTAFLPLFGTVTTWLPSALLGAAGLWLAWKAKDLLKVQGGEFPFMPAFMQINLFSVVVMGSAVWDAFVR